MGEDSGDKTEEPTQHKLNEARKKGQIAKSKEFTSAILLFVSFYTLRAFAIKSWDELTSFTAATFNIISEELNTSVFSMFLQEGLSTLFVVVGPLFAATFIIGVLIEALQTGFLFAPDALEPKLETLNPIQGFKKFFSLKQYVELLKSIIKMALVIWLLYYAIRDQYFVIIQSQVRSSWEIMVLVGKIVIKIVTQVGVLYFILALLDYVYQKYEFIKSMRMTKKEIKEEYKRLEGDPTIKQRQREQQRAMAQGRQMGAVPGADVVVTNPIHVAVALKYDEKLGNAPMVVAKGPRLVAQQIKNIADEHKIPIIERPELARALFKAVEPGQFIPPEYYQIVAEILAFVYHLKKKKAR